MTKARKEMESSLIELSLSVPDHRKPSSPKKKKEPVVDSWEDEDLSSGEDSDRPTTDHSVADYPDAPPPTPISPTSSYNDRNNGSYINSFAHSWSQSSNRSSPSYRSERNNATRPEKTDAVAKRLIAGALGVRAPKMTDEQRAYDRAIKEKEIKKRNGEKEAKLRADEEAARAKAAAWED